MYIPYTTENGESPYIDLEITGTPFYRNADPNIYQAYVQFYGQYTFARSSDLPAGKYYEPEFLGNVIRPRTVQVPIVQPMPCNLSCDSNAQIKMYVSSDWLLQNYDWKMFAYYPIEELYNLLVKPANHKINYEWVYGSECPDIEEDESIVNYLYVKDSCVSSDYRISSNNFTVTDSAVLSDKATIGIPVFDSGVLDDELVNIKILTYEQAEGLRGWVEGYDFVSSGSQPTTFTQRIYVGYGSGTLRMNVGSPDGSGGYSYGGALSTSFNVYHDGILIYAYVGNSGQKQTPSHFALDIPFTTDDGGGGGGGGSPYIDIEITCTPYYNDGDPNPQQAYLKFFGEVGTFVPAHGPTEDIYWIKEHAIIGVFGDDSGILDYEHGWIGIPVKDNIYEDESLEKSFLVVDSGIFDDYATIAKAVYGTDSASVYEFAWINILVRDEFIFSYAKKVFPIYFRVEWIDLTWSIKDLTPDFKIVVIEKLWTIDEIDISKMFSVKEIGMFTVKELSFTVNEQQFEFSFKELNGFSVDDIPYNINIDDIDFKFTVNEIDMFKIITNLETR